MARVSVSFRAEAERLLSRRRANWKKSLQKPELYECLPSPNPVNNDAGYLHSLRFLCYYPEDTDPLTIGELCDGLQLMPSLKHLMIRLPNNCPVSALEDISSVLARCTFSLKSLCISEHLDILPWILNQTEIETIAVHSSSRPWGFYNHKHLSCHRLLSSSPHHRNLPTFFIHCEGGQLGSVAAFPTFSAVWSANPIKEYLKDFPSPQVEIFLFCLYVQTLDELENSLSAVGSIISFTNVRTLELRVGDCMIHLNPQVLTSALSYLAGQLRMLHVRFWRAPLEDEQMAYSYKDQKSELAKAWSERCPSLDSISFPDGDGRRRDAGWGIREDITDFISDGVCRVDK